MHIDSLLMSEKSVNEKTPPATHQRGLGRRNASRSRRRRGVQQSREYLDQDRQPVLNEQRYHFLPVEAGFLRIVNLGLRNSDVLQESDMPR